VRPAPAPARTSSPSPCPIRPRPREAQAGPPVIAGGLRVGGREWSAPV